MSRWKLGSMVSKWVISPTYKMVYIGVITHLLAFDPNFLRHPSTPPPQCPQCRRPYDRGL